MKVSVARGDILDSLSIVNRGLSSRSTLPILSSVLLTADGEDLLLHSTDLEVSIKHGMKANVEQGGQTVIPGKLLSDIIRSMPEAAVTIDAGSQDEATVACDHSSFSVRTLHAEDFPKFPEVEAGMTVELSTDVVAGAVSQVAKASSRDETRPVLTGVLTVVEAGTLKMVATDSYRLAVREIQMDRPVEDFEVVIPGRAMEEIPRLAAGQETILMGIAENQVLLSFGETVYVSRRIEGRFPNYKQLIPSDSETKVTVDREELVEAVNRVSILARGQNVPMRVSVSPGDATMSLSATSQDVGSASEDLMVEAEGADVEIAFNAAFMKDGVVTPTSETVTLEIESPLKPGVLRSVGDEDFTYILMPVRIG